MPLCLASGLAGCVYFNGMYNARHWAGQAEASERAGRALEAADRWRLAQVHADSVIARHPRSRWAGEAYLVRGRAETALEDFGDAVVALEQARRVLAEPERRREAALYLGRANLGLRRYREALATLDSAADSRDARRRSLALLYRGRAHLALERPAAALADFRASREGEARSERVRAALALGDMPLAAMLAESLAAAPAFREAEWPALLDSLGRVGLREPASRLVDLLLQRADAGRGPQARLALADGDRRLAAGDSAAARARFRDVLRIAPDSVEGRAADLRQLRLELRAIDAAAELARVHERLEQLVALGGPPGLDARDMARLIEFADTLRAAEGPRDAYWFLRGEVLRDSLGATVLAAATFAQMADLFPDSPWTPKGLLAAIGAGHGAADSLRALLAGRYAASPYAAVAGAGSGADQPEAFAVLEDSLQRALRVLPGVAGIDERAPSRSRNESPTTRVPGPGQSDAPPRPSPRPSTEP